MAKTKTKEEFITDAKLVHGDKYSYSDVLYKNNYTKVSILCHTHGSFSQAPRDHLKGQNCPKCASNRHTREYVKFSTTNKTEVFIIKAQEIHKCRYIYTNVEYVDNKTKVNIVCKQHGTFFQSPMNHLEGKGCPKCGAIRTGELSHTTQGHVNSLDLFVNGANITHHNKYLYTLSVYAGTLIKLIITCPTHGDFEQTPNRHLAGNGCPSCAKNGFDPTKSAILYYLKINGGQCYKIGITNKSVDERFSNSELQLIEVVKTWYYEDGAEAYEAEQKILKDYSQYQYKGPDILKSGNTELFTIDVLGIT